jgi:hypothetical protein
MKFTIAVDESIYRSTNYLVEAKSKKEAHEKVTNHRWDEMKIIDTLDYDGSIDVIHSVERYKK